MTSGKTAAAEASDKESASTEGLDASQSRLGAYLSPLSFSAPQYVEQSAWLDHGPFAFWLIEALKPRSFVELGTHGGYSYFAFCQAVKAMKLDTQCYAVDHWKGDEHAGHYDEEIYKRVSSYNESHYASFSRLVRATFDEAVEHFEDGSVDLLHIDGRHFY
ncbi:MAG: class I SAM-dependent methyltransferase, partial [Rhodospirillaceae bacterium]|nr:class I SAM-dependent methyltransferase [Rhodospirillaceae bacterium]